MSQDAGLIAGATVRDRAVNLAGCLAELGQARLVLRSGGTEIGLAARVTDLPGVVEERVSADGEAVIEAPGLGAVFRVTRDSGFWTCGDPNAAAELRRRLHG
ncbi:MAG TPA: hypothetical protein VD971_13395 [Phycisphaerales bacterium]|nr:hypothetical protein [Phycisphaerales bacterium]